MEKEEGPIIYRSLYDDYDIDLTFTSENTNKSFTIYGGKLSRLHYDPSHDKDSVYVDYEEPRVAAPNIYISNHELFCFMDVDFDGQAEILYRCNPEYKPTRCGRVYCYL